jgi:hypothetical protein
MVTSAAKAVGQKQGIAAVNRCATLNLNPIERDQV